MYVMIETKDGKMKKCHATGIVVYTPDNHGGPCFLDGATPAIQSFSRQQLKTISLFFDDEHGASIEST